MFVFLEKKLGKDITKKIFEYLRELILLDILKIKIINYHMVFGKCSYILNNKRYFICSPRFLNWFYRKYGLLEHTYNVIYDF